MLYMLGALALDTRPFNVDEVSRSASADLASKPLMGTAPGKEFMGEGDETIVLSGQLLPFKIGGLEALEVAHSMRRRGARFPLHRGDGVRLGWYAITDMREAHSQLGRSGVGHIISHSITLTRVPPEAGDGQQIINALLSLFGVGR